MLVEQVLHIMQNQDYPRFLCFFRPQIYIYLPVGGINLVHT